MANVRTAVLGPNTVSGLIKLVGIVPPENLNVPLQARDEEAIKAKHEALAKAQGVEVGAVRKGIVDTGTPVVSNEALNLSSLIAMLVRAGYAVTNIHREQIPDKNRPGRMKNILVAVVEPGSVSTAVPEHLAWMQREMEVNTFEYVHIWDNQGADGTRNFTINAAHKLPTKPDDVMLALAFKSIAVV